MPLTNGLQLPSQNIGARVLVNGDGQIVALPLGAATDTIGTAGGGTATSNPAASGTASPFVINVTYAASAASAPPAFIAGVQAAVQYLENQFTDPVTINITIGYGDVAGTVMSATSLGTTLTYLTQTSYASLAAALAQDASTTNDATAVASLPASNPIPGGNFWISTAEAKALGLIGASTATDGYIGFSSTLPFDYNPADGITAGFYDFFAIAIHEITEVMGRTLLAGKTIGTTANSYNALDLFQYAAPGVRDFSAAGPGYFSPDGGVSNLGTFNTIAGGDAGDWGTNMGPNAFNAFSAAGVVNSVTAADLTVLDTIGWDLRAPAITAAAQPLSLSGTAGNDTIDIAARLGTSSAPAFVNGLAGNDVLNGLGMTSTLWLNGGAGADRMSGGSGANIYQFSATADSTSRAMDIITNFNADTDLLDLTAIGTALPVLGPITSGKLPAGSIGWQVIGGNTFVYVNTSTRPERLTGPDMRIELLGNIGLTGHNFATA